MATPGSWFGLPDFGITEYLAGQSSGGQTTDLSDSLRGNYAGEPTAPPTDYSQFASYPQPGVDPFAQSGGSQNSYSAPASGPAPAPAPSAPQTYAQQWSAMGREGTPPVGWHGESQPSQQDILNDQARGEIGQGYDRYFAELDAMLGEIPNQKTAQEGIVGSQYKQGVADLGAEQTTGLADLGMQRERTMGNQAKNLADLSESIRNQFLTGQVMLGTRGAGDSSAANQYSYALTKLGSKARGNVMSKTADITSEIDNREFKLNTIFSNEKTKLGSQRDQKISEIAQWFSEATNQIRQMRATGQISKGQDLASLTQNALNRAMQAAQMAQTAFINRQGMLEQWAGNNASNIAQLRTNMQGVASYQPQLPQFLAGQGQPSWDVGGNLSAPIGFGVGSEEERNI